MSQSLNKLLNYSPMLYFKILSDSRVQNNLLCFPLALAVLKRIFVPAKSILLLVCFCIVCLSLFSFLFVFVFVFFVLFCFVYLLFVCLFIFLIICLLLFLSEFIFLLFLVYFFFFNYYFFFFFFALVLSISRPYSKSIYPCLVSCMLQNLTWQPFLSLSRSSSNHYPWG